MKLKMLTSMEGPKVSLVRGDTREFGEEEAKRLIDAGFAEEFIEAPSETDEEKLDRLEREAAALREGLEARKKAAEEAAAAKAKAEEDAKAKAAEGAAAAKAKADEAAKAKAAKTAKGN